MASWKCEQCFITMDADAYGEPEVCPKCGEEMALFKRKSIRMFGGGGVQDEAPGESSVGKPDAGR
ncbi:MAG: hypothetical protein WD602_09450 [Actinomycetota bacterium]